jgi:ElaB/YqjD/DUF883 family membrane-anchored ribosome-binding protein
MDVKRTKDVTDTAMQSIDNVAGQLQAASKQFGAIGSNVQKAVDNSLADQPYMTLAMAAAAGFVLGMIWHRA